MPDARDLARQKNTDRELWRGSHDAGDYYADSVHVTADERIGIQVGGTVYEKTTREWVGLAREVERARAVIADDTADRLTDEELQRIAREARHAAQTKHPPGDSWIRGYAEDVPRLLDRLARAEAALDAVIVIPSRSDLLTNAVAKAMHYTATAARDALGGDDA